MDLKATRKAAGLTQVAAAKLLGVSERAWRNWETGAKAMPQAHRELFDIKARERIALRDVTVNSCTEIS